MNNPKSVATAVALATLAVSVRPQAACGQGAFLATVDDFRSGGFTRTFSLTTPAAQVTQNAIGGGVMGDRRLSSLAAPMAAGGSGSTGAVTVNTAGTGTLAASTTASVHMVGMYVFSYGRVGDATSPSLMADFNFPGTHGLAIDFLSLSGPITVEINIGTWSTTTTGITQGTWTGTISPDPSGGPFRFRTTWSMYAVQPGFNIASVDYINVGFRLPPGTSFVVDGIGVSPSPGAGWALGLVGLTTVRRRRH